jgi:ankyrin repeat protein
MMAIENNNFNIFKLLIDEGTLIDLVDSQKKTILMYCSLIPDIDLKIVELIFKSDEKIIDMQDENGFTVLMHCFSCKHVNRGLIQILLDNDPNLHIKSNENKDLKELYIEVWKQFFEN